MADLRKAFDQICRKWGHDVFLQRRDWTKGEVGPWGNSRTRWQMEAEGEFSLEGCIQREGKRRRIVYKNLFNGGKE